MSHISAKDFIDLIKANPPAQNEAIFPYCERIAPNVGLTPGGVQADLHLGASGTDYAQFEKIVTHQYKVSLCSSHA